MFGKPRKGWIGVDIGSYAVKIAQVVCDRDGFHVKHAAVIPRIRPWPIDQMGTQSPPLDSHAEVHGAYQCAAPWTGSLAACALPMHIYDFRGMHLPSSSHSERRMMISNEFAETWNTLEAGYEFDYWDTQIPGVKFRKDEPNISILALSKAWARQADRDMARAGLRCALIDGPPLATARTIGTIAPKHGAEPVAVLDWGFMNTTFSIVFGSRPVFIRRIRGCGLGLVTQAIQTTLGVTLDQSQHLLQTVGFPDPHSNSAPADPKQNPPPNIEPAPTIQDPLADPDPDHALLARALAEAAVEPLHQLADQINRTLAYFQAQRRALIPSKLWISGGGGGIRNLDTYLGHDIPIPIETWRLPNAPIHQDNRHPIAPALLAGAIGLSLLALAS
ncbi:MAG: hypothetical protein JW829_08535 [Pirellulales bacterium]|nr:hypothetical protein [Pirellulales bacterium]